MVSLISARRRAERLMRCTVRVTRFTGEPKRAPGSLEPVRDSVTVYKGKGKIQSYEAHEQPTSTGGASVTVTRLRLDVPVGAFKALPGDEVEVLTSPDDPELVGLKVRVASIAPYKSAATAYRMFVDETTRG